MKLKNVLFIAAAGFLLTGCQTLPKTVSEMPPPPDKEEIMVMAYRSYLGTVGREGKDLQLHSVTAHKFFEGYDWAACISSAEVTEGNIYTHSKELKTPDGTVYGKGLELKVAEGTPTRRMWTMMIRLYDDGWGAPFFRHGGAKIGFLKVSDVCKSSN